MNELKQYATWKKEISDLVRANLNGYLNIKGLTQTELSRRIKNEFGVICDESTISRALDGTIQISLPLVLMLSRILRVPVETFAQSLNTNRIQSRAISLESSQKVEDVLYGDFNRTFNPGDSSFGSLDKKYYCYFWPTDGTGKTPHEAILTLIPNGDLCEADFCLSFSNGKECKAYKGFAFTSKADICFCLLTGRKNVSTREICILAFKYVCINHGLLPVALAEALTVSAGNTERVPVVHRVLLSKYKLASEHIPSIAPYISFQSSQFLVQEDSVQGNNIFTQTELDLLNKLLAISPRRQYSHVSRMVIEGLALQNDFSREDIARFLAKLKKISISMRNDTATTDDGRIIYELLEVLGYDLKKTNPEKEDKNVSESLL